LIELLVGTRNLPWNDGFLSFRKITDFQGLGPSDALVFADERDDSIDDGEFAIDMVGNQIVNVPAAYHGGSGGLAFGDGHAEIHRWRTPEVHARSKSAPKPGNGSSWRWLPTTPTWSGCASTAPSAANDQA
jgi:prepilin-type processing-associated H-X9-DG protein